MELDLGDLERRRRPSRCLKAAQPVQFEQGLLGKS